MYGGDSLKPKESDCYEEMHIDKQKKIIKKMTAELVDKYISAEDHRMEVVLPYDKEDLY